MAGLLKDPYAPPTKAPSGPPTTGIPISGGTIGGGGGGAPKPTPNPNPGGGQGNAGGAPPAAVPPAAAGNAPPAAPPPAAPPPDNNPPPPPAPNNGVPSQGNYTYTPPVDDVGDVAKAQPHNSIAVYKNQVYIIPTIFNCEHPPRRDLGGPKGKDILGNSSFYPTDVTPADSSHAGDFTSEGKAKALLIANGDSDSEADIMRYDNQVNVFWNFLVSGKDLEIAAINVAKANEKSKIQVQITTLQYKLGPLTDGCEAEKIRQTLNPAYNIPTPNCNAIAGIEKQLDSLYEQIADVDASYALELLPLQIDRTKFKNNALAAQSDYSLHKAKKSYADNFIKIVNQFNPPGCTPPAPPTPIPPKTF